MLDSYYVLKGYSEYFYENQKTQPFEYSDVFG